MKLWTTQNIGFYEDLMTKGIAYCNQVSEMAQEYDYAYGWMAEQMRKRIGEPPLPEIKLPVWAWYQYDSKKRRNIPLNAGHIIRDKALSKKIEAYYPCEFSDFPPELQEVIKESWEVVFDLKNRDKRLSPKAIRNKSIQATLWCVRNLFLVYLDVF